MNHKRMAVWLWIRVWFACVGEVPAWSPPWTKLAWVMTLGSIEKLQRFRTGVKNIWVTLDR